MRRDVINHRCRYQLTARFVRGAQRVRTEESRAGLDPCATVPPGRSAAAAGVGVAGQRAAMHVASARLH
jgi:hypothetical protein